MSPIKEHYDKQHTTLHPINNILPAGIINKNGENNIEYIILTNHLLSTTCKGMIK